jgi:Skp family chaperone for outer membrane proteins
MKKNLIIAFLALLSVLNLGAADIKVAVVNMDKAFQAYYKTVEANKKFQSSGAKLQEEIGKVNGQLQELVKELQRLQEEAQNPALSDEMRAEQQKVIDEKRIEGQRKQEDVRRWQATYQQEQEKERQKLIGEIRTKALELSKGKGVNLLLDVSPSPANGLSTVVDYDTAWEITDELVTQLNISRPADIPAAQQ